MSLYYNLLQEQVDLLKEKGYEEKIIGSPDKEGWLFTQLHRGFSNALHQSLQEGEPVTFQIAATGFFNEDKDIVHFKFDYEFNLERNTLSLKEMELVADKTNRKISIQSPKDVPHSSQALALIAGQSQLQRKRMNEFKPVHATKQQKRIR